MPELVHHSSPSRRRGEWGIEKPVATISPDGTSAMTPPPLRLSRHDSSPPLALTLVT